MDTIIVLLSILLQTTKKIIVILLSPYIIEVIYGLSEFNAHFFIYKESAFQDIK